MQNFEKWLASNKDNIDSVTYQLFSDSLRCFKFDIDRPSYLLAYQGMMYHLKMVLLHSKRPEDFPETQWIDHLKELNNDHSWDGKIYDLVMTKAVDNKQNPTKNRPAVFCITEEIRNKFPFWRDIRNVCAHYKEYNFIKSHTLVLYSFIAQYLLMITVEGGQDSLLRDFKKHYNPALTPENEDAQFLIDKIPQMIKIEEFEKFLNELCSIIGPWETSEIIYILHKIYMSLPDPYKTMVIDYIHKDRSIETYFIDEYPDSILILLKDKSEIREFWYNRIFTLRNPLEILAQLILSGRLEGSEIKEAFDRILSRYYEKGNIFNLDNKVSLNVLKNAGFLDVFENKYYNSEFMSRNCKEICYKTDFFILLLNVETINDQFVDRTLKIFNSMYYPFKLADRIRDELLVADNPFNDQFRAVLSKKNKNLPNCLN